MENKRKCLSATKCQRQLRELWEIHIGRTTFPQVKKACFRVRYVFVSKGHTITFRQISVCDYMVTQATPAAESEVTRSFFEKSVYDNISLTV